jgi:hypothetical protein
MLEPILAGSTLVSDAQRGDGIKLLFVDSNRGRWGMEQHFISLAIGMALRGHRVQVLLRQGSAMEPAFRGTRLPVHTARFGGGGDPRLLGRLLRLIVQTRPDWLVANDGKLYWPLLILGRLAGIRVALFRHQDVR